MYATYLLQLKEYRHDRLREHLLRKHKHAYLALFYTGIGAPISFKMLPRLTNKAVVLIFLSLLIGGALIYSFGAPGVLFLLLFSLGIVLLALSITTPVEALLRQSTYRRARTRVEELKRNGLKVVGITGSYGKTSTKDILAHILSSSFSVLATKNSINTPLGVARTILNELRPEHAFFVVEMGAYKIGEIAELCDIALPDIGIITGISNQHLSLFGSQENIIKGKSELFDSLKPNSAAYFNSHSLHMHQTKNTNLSIVEYSEKSLSPHMQKALKEAALPNELRLNVIPAILIAKDMGISEEDIASSILSLAPSEKTMKSVVGRGGALIIDDSHNASEMGVLSAISFLSTLSQKTKIVVMPCIIELGEDAEGVHKNIGTTVKASNIKAIITTPDFFNSVLETAGDTHARLLSDPIEVCAYLKERLSDNCAIVLEGKTHPKIIEFLLPTHHE